MALILWPASLALAALGAGLCVWAGGFDEDDHRNPMMIVIAWAVVLLAWWIRP